MGVSEKGEFIIRNGLLLSMTPDQPAVQGDVQVRDGRIAAIEPRLPSGRGRVREIDAAGCLVMPGLVNGHTHLPMSLLRGLGDDLPLNVWLSEVMFPAEAEKMTPEAVYAWARHSCRELLLSGTTTCCDGYFHEDQVAEAVLDTGIRAVVGQGVIDFPAPGVPDPGRNIDVAVRFADLWSGRSSRVIPSIFCHSPYTCGATTLKAAKKACDERGILFQIHAAETEAESGMIPEGRGMSPLAYLDSLGVVDERTLLVHGVWLSSHDRQRIQARRAGVVHCPESNMKLASGIAPVPDLLADGIRVGLGTDGSASNNNLDLFTEMDLAAKLHKAARSDPCVMDAPAVVHMATLGGAGVLGLDKEIGSLAVGKKADIIVIDLEKPHLVPMYHPLSTLVYSVRGSDVRDVMVDGRLLVQNGCLTDS